MRENLVEMVPGELFGLAGVRDAAMPLDLAITASLAREVVDE